MPFDFFQAQTAKSSNNHPNHPYNDPVFGPSLNKIQALFGISYNDDDHDQQCDIPYEKPHFNKDTTKSASIIHHKLSKYIFKKKKIRLNKNNNLPKFFCQVFLTEFYRYYRSMNEEGKEDQVILNEIKYFVAKERKIKSDEKHANSSLKNLEVYFGTYPHLSSNCSHRNLLTRKMFHKILRQNICKLVYHNGQLVKKKEYGMAIKLMISRSRNQHLVCRNQIVG